MKLTLFLIAILTFGDAASAQTPVPASAAAGPTTAWTCPMHREIGEVSKGICPICKMDLVETRVEAAWTCPLHPVIVESAGGVCRICKRELVPVTVEVAWVCPVHPEEAHLEPGACPACRTTLVRRQAARPHTDHNPKHGGIFFMAPDNWHHLEGTYPEPGVFRVHVYDNYSKPLAASMFRGRAVLKEEYDEARRETRELVAYPLLPTPDGTYLEAKIGTLAVPVEITAKIRFEPDRPEDRFDFIFAEHSMEPTGATAPAPTAAGLALVVPERPTDIATEIMARSQQIQELIRRGAFTEVFIPALEAKDLALALEAHLAGLPAERQDTARLAVKQLVRAAWLLDWFGDLGDRQKVTSAYQLFGSAVQAISTAFAEPAP